MNVINRLCACKGPIFQKKPRSGRSTTSTTIIASSPPDKTRSYTTLTEVNSPQRMACCNNLTLVSRPALTQVRFSKFPRFHRDLEYPSFDDYRKNQFIDVRKTSWGQGDQKPGPTYAVAFTGFLSGIYAAKSICTYFVTYMSAAADVLALASVEIDLSKIAPGACDIVKWRGKPLFIKHRTEADIELEKNTPLGTLRDPESPEVRTQKQQWLIIIGICTHLGCVPIANVGDYPGGFYCPCHGSHYDNLGRIRKGPAPTNMVVPPYKFVSDSMVLVG